jgi:hypothetical protein
MDMRTLAAWLPLALAPLTHLVAQEQEAEERYSVQPPVDLQPGYTLDPRQTFTLELGGIGREPIRILAIEANGRRLPDSAWRTQLGRLEIAPDADLRVGLNRVTIRYEHRVDRMHQATDNPVQRTFFVNHQRARVGVDLGDRGELIVGGVPRFVRGGYRSGQGDRFTEALPSAADAGLSLVHDYKFERENPGRAGVEAHVKGARAYLKRAHQLGLGVFMGLPRAAVRNYDEEVLAAIVSALSNEPALWLWYVYDEPTEATLAVETASRIHGLLRRLDPNRPAVMLANSVSAVLRYHPFCDLLWYDRYPIVATAHDLISLAPIAAALQASRDVVPAGKPVWPVLQVQDNRGSPSLRRRMVKLAAPSDDTHRPTVGEIRAESHVAIAQGSMGLVYYWAPDNWYSMKTDTPGTWAGFSQVLHELAQIEPALLSRESPPEFRITGSHDKVMMWTRQYGGDVYVGLVNAAQHAKAELKLQAPFSPASMKQLSGDGKARLDGRTVRVNLGSTAVVVLTLRLP